ncbi:MAG TPA: RDD family protein [Lentisphaeria bacterium]|nr:MAG: transporter [Lentisphaerae bacterium GWF2_49_21]HBC86145.1 RDD family protein [Lentisphaeria bacterium]
MVGARTNLLEVATPEGVSFSIALAGPASRCTAWLIDLACIIALQSLLTLPLKLLNLISVDFATALSIILYFAISILYGIMLEWFWDGRTVGKRILHLRVMDMEGLRLQFSQVMVRNLLRVVDVLPAFYLLGGTFCLVSRNYQRLGDLAARTVVVRETRTDVPDITGIMPEKYNSFKAYPHLVARARENISPENAALLQDALLRRNTLSPEVRNEVYAEFAGYFKGLCEFPQEATDGLSDERYLRNLVEILFVR